MGVGSQYQNLVSVAHYTKLEDPQPQKNWNTPKHQKSKQIIFLPECLSCVSESVWAGITLQQYFLANSLTKSTH